MNIFLYITLFFIGIIIGSFWKIAIYRMPRNIGIMKKIISYPISNDLKFIVIIEIFIRLLFYSPQRSCQAFLKPQ